MIQRPPQPHPRRLLSPPKEEHIQLVKSRALQQELRVHHTLSGVQLECVLVCRSSRPRLVQPISGGQTTL